MCCRIIIRGLENKGAKETGAKSELSDSGEAEVRESAVFGMMGEYCERGEDVFGRRRNGCGEFGVSV